LVAVVFALIALGLFAGPASAADHAAAASGPVAALQLPSAELVSSPRIDSSAHAPLGQADPVTTTPAPNFNQQVANADTATAKHKLAVGVAAVILLVIVYFGRRMRNRHARKLKNLQNAKS
jgi:hypothetical protein